MASSIQGESLILPGFSASPLKPVHHVYREGRSENEMIRLRRLVVRNSERQLSLADAGRLLDFLRAHRTDFVGDGCRIFTLLGGCIAELSI